MPVWDESKHPRVPGGKVNGGRFTEKEVETATNAATKAAGVDSVESVILSKIKEISGLAFERFYAIHPEDGSVAFTADGGEGYVRIEENDQLKTTDMITIHNHPGGNAWARFSMSDIEFAIRLNQKELRVVAGDYLISLKRPGADWSSLDSNWQEEFTKRVALGLVERVSEFRGRSAYELWGFGAEPIMNIIDGSLPEVQSSLKWAFSRAGLEYDCIKWK